MKAHYWMAGLLAAYMPLALAQEVVVLGDSLSDVGQPGWNLKATYAKADGSLNSLYDEHIAKALGGTATASGKGGNNLCLQWRCGGEQQHRHTLGFFPT